MELLEKEAVATQTRDLSGDRVGGGPELAGDLAVGGAAQDPQKERLQEIGTLQPVGGMEGL
jgi:hypothetical protein